MDTLATVPSYQVLAQHRTLVIHTAHNQQLEHVLVSMADS